MADFRTGWPAAYSNLQIWFARFLRLLSRGDAQPSPKWPLVFRRRLFSRFARSIRIVTAKFEKRGLSESGPRKLLNLTGREPRFAGRCVYRPRVKPARRVGKWKAEEPSFPSPLPSAASASQRLPPDGLETWIDSVTPENLFPTGTLLPPTPFLSHPDGGSVQTQR
jgi:hypothetical protein